MDDGLHDAWLGCVSFLQSWFPSISFARAANDVSDERVAVLKRAVISSWVMPNFRSNALTPQQAYSVGTLLEGNLI